MGMHQYLTAQFKHIFSTKLMPRCFFAPGRINLIGEHTDYNGGHVFPAAISYGTYALVTKRDDNHFRMYSLNLPDKGIIEFTLDELNFNQKHNWANYPKGMMQYMQRTTNCINKGLDILYFGNIPNGAGLSSSASIEMVTGTLLNELFSLPFNKMDIIHIGQKVENEYLGVQSGIMDQFAVGMGKVNHAVLLNTSTLEYLYAPLQLQEHDIIIIHTNKRRSLTSSAYNTRRKQCEAALKDLQTELHIEHLSDITPETFERYKKVITSDINRKRAKHVIYENERTKQALIELQQHNIKKFGQLINESHISLRDDYEVTGKELDTIAEASWKQPGVIGARMTGAGFGGCAIAIVERSHTKTFQENITRIYMNEIDYKPTFYAPKIAGGAQEIKLDRRM